MLTPLVLFVGLTLATAVIAYWSDNLGKKLGKKRVSLWGLRPRTTATFLTIASSWLIMVFTLGVMLALFSPLRQALLRYDEVKADVNDLNESKTQLTGQLTALTGQTDELEAQVKEASEKLGEVSEQLKQSRAAAKKAREERKVAREEADSARESAQTYRKRELEANRRVAQASKNLANVTRQRDATQRQRVKAQTQLDKAQDELNEASEKVRVANQRVKNADARAGQAESQVAQAESKLSQVKANLLQVQTDLKTVRTDVKLAKQNAKIAQDEAKKAQRDADKSRFAASEADKKAKAAATSAFNAGNAAYKAGREKLEVEAQVEQAQQKVKQLQAQSDALARDNRAVLDANGIILASNILVPVGRTLVARSFDSNASFRQTDEALRALFARAADQIVPGLLPGATLELAPQKVVARKENPSDPNVLVVLNEDEIYNELATAIARSRNPLSVRLVSDRNHLQGEEILEARFIVVPIRPVFPANEALASAVFDGKNGDARLFSALSELVEVGREVASRSGVTPPLSPEVPSFYAPGTNEQLFETLRKITALDGPARVTITTAAPISTADQLSVRFEVEPAATTAKAPAKRKAKPA